MPLSRTLGSLFVAQLALLMAACGTPQLNHTVDSSKLTEMSRDGQVWIYEAENGIVVALDQLDEAKQERSSIRRRIRAAEENLDRVKSKGPRQAEDAIEKQLDYLNAMFRWTDELVELEELGVVVARAAVELAKAEVIQREDLLAGKDFSVQAFRGQHEDLKNSYEQKEKHVQSLRTVARRAAKDWWEARSRYISLSRDYDTGLWLD